MAKLYLIGSLRNPDIPSLANELKPTGWDVFAAWYAAGPTADDCWRDYEKARGRTYVEALKGRAAKHVFDFDKHHLDTADAGVLVLPAGRSGHLEAGYLRGQGKPVVVLIDNPERWDVMYQFLDVVTTREELLEWAKSNLCPESLNGTSLPSKQPSSLQLPLDFPTQTTYPTYYSVSVP